MQRDERLVRRGKRTLEWARELSPVTPTIGACRQARPATEGSDLLVLVTGQTHLRARLLDKQLIESAPKA